LPLDLHDGCACADLARIDVPRRRRLAAFQLGRCFALGGDVAKARQWLGAIKRRGSGLDKRSATTKRTGTG
jgi:hypothetical protein